LPSSTRLAPRCVPVGSCGRPAWNPVNTERMVAVEEVTEEPAERVERVERVAALAVGKATLVACVRVPHDAKPGRRRQEVRTFATTTRSLPGAGGRIRRTPSGWPSSPERGMLRGQALYRRRGSRVLRTPTRYRRTLIHERTREQQRVEQAAGGRPDQAERGGCRQLRVLRPDHAGRADRRRTQTRRYSRSWHRAGRAPSWASWPRRSPGTSAPTTATCRR
jgi:hypothetical protein